MYSIKNWECNNCLVNTFLYNDIHIDMSHSVNKSNCITTNGNTKCDAHEYLSTSFTFVTDIHARLSRSSSSFQVYTPKPHLEIYRNRFVFSGSSIWNSLSSYIQNSNSVQHFKSQYLCWINPKPSHARFI